MGRTVGYFWEAELGGPAIIVGDGPAPILSKRLSGSARKGGEPPEVEFTFMSG